LPAKRSGEKVSVAITGTAKSCPKYTSTCVSVWV
jgi:hypothetical protein